MTPKYFDFVSKELLAKLSQVREMIKKHNPTIGILTEEIIKDFLRKHLPKKVAIEQGFIMAADGTISKQCDILIYNCIDYPTFYRINDIVIVPSESVLAVIEVKTTVDKASFNSALDYFRNILEIVDIPTYLFIYSKTTLQHIANYLSENHFYHDTFQYLPDNITCIETSFLLKKDYVITERDSMGYNAYHFKDERDKEISAFQHFFFSILDCVSEDSISKKLKTYSEGSLYALSPIPLFDM